MYWGRRTRQALEPPELRKLRQRKSDDGRQRYRPSRRKAGWTIAIVAMIAIAVPIVYSVLHFVDQLHIMDTAQQFCRYEGAGNYSAAYQMLSHRVQQQVSLDDFTTASKQAGIKSCDPNQDVLSLDVSTDSTRLYLGFYVTHGSDTASREYGDFWLVRESAGWQVDAMYPNYLNLP